MPFLTTTKPLTGAPAATRSGCLASGWRRWVLVVLVCGLMLVGSPTAIAAAASPYQLRSPSRDGIGKVYMGREIAQVMGYQGADWLERSERSLAERPQLVMPALDLQPNDVVADIGAGTGYFSRRLAAQVPQGHVFAVDVQPAMLTRLQSEIAAKNLANVEPVLGTETDPRLPAASLDLALLVDAYHEFEYPYEMMTHLVEALKPGGRVVLAEYRGENRFLPIKHLHKMTAAQVRRELQSVGLQWLKTDDRLPQQHLLFFEKPAD